LAAEGVQVAICGRSEQAVTQAAKLIGPTVVPLVADLSEPAAAGSFVAAARVALGGLDILVTNSGGPPAGTFASTTWSQYPAALALNLLSVVAMCEAAVPGMRAQGWGRVVAVTSIAARQPIPNIILSNTARAGVTGFLKTLAREVAADGVTVNSVQPGSHATARLVELYAEALPEHTRSIPARRLGSPQQFGAVVAFLCSEQASFVTGAAIPVDGGQYAGLL
jgi:3-oxoacyl-[acyl-carrier protein] reductase